MGLAKRVIGALLLTGAAALFLASLAFAQERVGVVTNIEGTAMVARSTPPQPQPLQFKDGVYVYDRITTGERSMVRVLLGGKATVTARERSVLTITEVPGTSTITLGSGRISVAVSKGLMKAGEIVEIKTPNAVTAIRGTVVVADVTPTVNGVRSTITVLRGLVDVTRLDQATGQRVGSPVDVAGLQTITAVGAKPLSRPVSITPDEGKQLAGEFHIVPRNAPSNAAAIQQATREAAVDAQALLSRAVQPGATIVGGGEIVGEALSSDTAATVTLSSVSTTTTSTGNPSLGSTATIGGAAPILNPTVDVKVKDLKDSKPLKIKLK